jgi:hypothetical protein
MWNVRVTGWDHGKVQTGLLGNGTEFATVGEANAAAAKWEDTMHKRHPKTASRYTAEVVPRSERPRSYKVYRDGEWVPVTEVTRDGMIVRVRDDGSVFDC